MSGSQHDPAPPVDDERPPDACGNCGKSHCLTHGHGQRVFANDGWLPRDEAVVAACHFCRSVLDVDGEWHRVVSTGRRARELADDSDTKTAQEFVDILRNE